MGRWHCRSFHFPSDISLPCPHSDTADSSAEAVATLKILDVILDHIAVPQERQVLCHRSDVRDRGSVYTQRGSEREGRTDGIFISSPILIHNLANLYR